MVVYIKEGWPAKTPGRGDCFGENFCLLFHQWKKYEGKLTNTQLLADGQSRLLNQLCEETSEPYAEITTNSCNRIQMQRYSQKALAEHVYDWLSNAWDCNKWKLLVQSIIHSKKWTLEASHSLVSAQGNSALEKLHLCVGPGSALRGYLI